MYTFSRINRLTQAHDYKRVFSKAVKVYDSVATVLARENNQCIARVGIVVAKRNVAKAVDRVRLKRIVRESFRHKKMAIKGYDIVFIIKKEAAPLANTLLREKVDTLWQRLQQRLKNS